MTKLCQIIAIAGSHKSEAQSVLKKVHQALQKPDLLSGLNKTYQPRDDEGEPLPPESKRVQLRVTEAISEVQAVLGRTYDLVATQDEGNRHACADIVVDDVVLVIQVPVTHLLFLEKQLVDLGTFVAKLPVLDPAYEWTWSDEANCYRTAPVKNVRTKKVPKSVVMYEATEHHPAQVQAFTEDVVIGEYTRIDYSGAIPETVRNKMLGRVRKLQDAVKKAREEANSMPVGDQKVGSVLLDYLFGG